jgi:hypothetical protein
MSPIGEDEKEAGVLPVGGGAESLGAGGWRGGGAAVAGKPRLWASGGGGDSVAAEVERLRSGSGSEEPYLAMSRSSMRESLCASAMQEQFSS